LAEYSGIILKKISYKESSEIIYLYTDQGLISVLVHGSKTLKSPYLNLTKVLNNVKLNTSGKNLLVLRDGDVLTNYSSIHNDLEKYTYLLQLMEMIYYFSTHEHDHAKLYNFLIKVLDAVKEKEDYIPYINMVELKLLYLLGVNPNFNSCMICDSKDNLSFSVNEGGCLCQEHKTGYTYSHEVLDALKKLYYHDINKEEELVIKKDILREVRIVIDEYYDYHLNYHSKTRKMLRGLIGY